MSKAEPIEHASRRHFAHRAFLLWCSASIILIACSDGPAPEATQGKLKPFRSPPGKYDPTSYTYRDSVADSMHFAAMRGDSAFCRTRLPLFDDTLLARTRPDLIVAGFFCDVIAHGSYPGSTLEKLQRLADAVDNGGLQVWHDYFIGRHRQNIGDHMGAIHVFLDVLPKFIEMGDTNGIATVSKRIGHMYVSVLRDPQRALPYLRRAYSMEPNIEDKYDIVNILEQCYRELELPDSIDRCLDFYQAQRNAPALVVANDARAETYIAWAAFDQLALRIIRDGQSDADHLRTRLVEARRMLEGADSNSLMDATEQPIKEIGLLMLNARALLRLNSLNEASATLSEAEDILRVETGQHALAAGVYDLFSQLHRVRGEAGKALHYRDLQVDAIQLADLDDERSAMASAMAKANFDQELRSEQDRYQIERAQAQVAIERVRSQRIILLVISILVLIIAALLVNRFRLGRRLQVEQLRTRLSRDLHDDIGSTLSSINILSSVVQKRIEATGDSDSAASLAKISDRSQRLMRNMSDIVWSVDPKNDSLQELIMRMREFATSVFEAKGITYTFDLPADVPTLVLTVEMKNNLYLIFKEAVNNVVKHANATHVVISLALRGRSLHLEVRDDGIGIGPSTNTRHGGNGLRNMLHRAEEVHATLTIAPAPGKGTQLLLEVPLR